MQARGPNPQCILLWLVLSGHRVTGQTYVLDVCLSMHATGRKVLQWQREQSLPQADKMIKTP
jgi:hypothetical protein